MQNLRRIAFQNFACLGQNYRIAFALKKARAVLLFEFANMFCDGRLTDKQLARSLGKAEMLGYATKNS
jgi:hypothetical protein